jgi:SseB protein N-terminal domain
MTLLDDAYAAMAAQTDDDAARLRYYARLSDGEMVMLLEREVTGGRVEPRIFDLQDGPVVLIFDSEEKLAAFAAGVAPYVALPGRVIAQQLAGQGIGLGVNMGAASMMLFPPDAVDWLAGTLEEAPVEDEARPVLFHAPDGVPDMLIAAVAEKLASAGGLAAHGMLSGVTYADGRRGHIFAFVDAVAGAEAVLARAVAEALIFSGVEAGEIDVTFLAGDDPGAMAMAPLARRFDLQGPVAEAERPLAAPPGMDKTKPPILR